MIYAIQSGDFVKIGFSASPSSRLKAIKTYSPMGCSIIGLMDGTTTDEREIHQKFSGLQTQGEWFKLNSELRDWISKNMIPPKDQPLEMKPKRKSSLPKKSVVAREDAENERMLLKLNVKKSKGPPEFWDKWATGEWCKLEGTNSEIARLRHRLYKAVKRKNATIETKVSDGVFYFRIQKQPAIKRSSK